MKCDGCRGEIVLMTEAVSFGENSVTFPKWYHQACWQTGWYTGIPPKGDWPEPEKTLPDLLAQTEPDPVSHPGHYTWLKNGVEVIDITENFNFLLGNVLKYVMRADHKGKPLEDLRKAVWYLEREIANREAAE